MKPYSAHGTSLGAQTRRDGAYVLRCGNLVMLHLTTLQRICQLHMPICQLLCASARQTQVMTCIGNCCLVFAAYPLPVSEGDFAASAQLLRIRSSRTAHNKLASLRDLRASVNCSASRGETCVPRSQLPNATHRHDCPKPQL
jgi:hypothetical protein